MNREMFQTSQSQPSSESANCIDRDAEQAEQRAGQLKAPTVAALLTCFNRREKTLGALEAIFSQNESVPRQLSVFLVDDNSTDGTAKAVATSYPTVRLLHGTGSLFWNGGMRIAFAEAMQSDFDYYLWINDDTHLLPDALDILLNTAQVLEQEGKSAIVVGSTFHPVHETWTYGGIRREFTWKGVRLTTVLPSADAPQPCDTVNGNCTLIPRSVAQKVGNLDPAFRHAIGDFDYGFRARKAGFEIYVARPMWALAPQIQTRAPGATAARPSVCAGAICARSRGCRSRSGCFTRAATMVIFGLCTPSRRM